MKANIFAERNIIKRGGVLMAGVGSCPWCEIPCMEWILIWPRVSGLWPRSYSRTGCGRGWQPLKQRDKGHHTRPPTHLEHGWVTLKEYFDTLSFQNLYHHTSSLLFLSLCNNNSPRVVMVWAPVVRRASVFATRAGAEWGLATAVQGCSVLCQLGDCSTHYSREQGNNERGN